MIQVQNAERAYGDINPTFEYTYDGEDDLIGSPSISCDADKTSSVGDYVINIDYGNITHKFYELRNGTLHINKTILQVSTQDYTIAKGEDIPSFELSYDGFKNGEDESILTVKPSATTTASKDSPLGTYPIVISGGEADNYSFDYKDGNLTIADNGTTSIRNTYIGNSKTEIYDIKGIRCEETKPVKGLYIVNGKKIIIK